MGLNKSFAHSRPFYALDELTGMAILMVIRANVICKGGNRDLVAYGSEN